MATLISFSPNTPIKSADVNANFTNLANGSAFTAGATIDSLNLTTLGQVSGVVDNGNQNGTYNIDWSKSDRQKVTVTGAITLTYSNAKAGQILSLDIIENATGNFSITLPTSKYPNGSAQSFITTPNAKNTATIKYDGTDYLTTVLGGWA